MRPWPCTARCLRVGVSHRPVQRLPAHFAVGVRPALTPPAPRRGGLRGAPDLPPSRGARLVLRAPDGRGAGPGPFRRDHSGYAGGRGVFLASKAVERQEWESYVEGIETKSRLEGLQALGFARYVRPEERAAFVSEATKEGLPEMRPDLDPGGERSAYFPLALVAPTDEANLSMINQDA